VFTRQVCAGTHGLADLMTGNTTEFIEIPGLDGVSVVRHAGPSPTEARHMHQSLCIGAVLSGDRPFKIEDAWYTVLAGQVMIISPNVPHACPDAGKCEYLMVSIPLSCFEATGFDPAVLSGIKPINDDPACFGAIFGLAQMAATSASRLERQSALIRVLESLRTEGSRQDLRLPEPDRIARVRRELEERCVEDVPLKTLARLAGCSPCRLNRDFASVVGMPPHEYQAMQRVRRVKTCIRNGKSLAESAMEAGFSDQSHMTRCFKKVMGMTPGKFARGLPSACLD